MKYLLDTNVIIRHFAQISPIGKKAKEIIREAEQSKHTLIISVISLMEIMYLFEKKRIPISLNEIVNQIQQKQCYSIIELNIEILKVAESIQFYELHDRLILGTAKFLDIPILSSDSKFNSLKEITTIWN